MGASVQFVGREAVIRAFNKMKLPKWSLWQNSRDMVTSYNDNDETDSERELEEWLNMFRGNTTGIFTLKLYDKAVKDIKPTTPHQYAINFRLSDEQENARMNGVPYGMDKLIDTMTTRFDKMDQRLKELEQDPGEEPLAPWERALENPVIMAGIGKIFNIDPSKFQVAESVSGVPHEDSDESPIEILRRLDPEIDKRLAKLARIATKDLKKYKFFGTMLDSQPG